MPLKRYSYPKRSYYGKRKRSATSKRTFNRYYGLKSGITQREGRFKNKMMLYRNPLNAGTIYTTLQYNDVIQLNPKPADLSTTSNWVFAMNDMYDPDITSTGHQPMYFDTYSQVYNRYRVNYAQICCTIVNHEVNTATSDNLGVISKQPNYAYKFGILADRDGTDYPSTFNTLIEEGGSNIKWRFVAPSLNGTLPKLYHSGSPHKLTGLSYNDEALQADIGTSPSRITKFVIFCTSADGVTDPPSVYVNVKIKYYCQFFDRRVNIAQN